MKNPYSSLRLVIIISLGLILGCSYNKVYMPKPQAGGDITVNINSTSSNQRASHRSSEWERFWEGFSQNGLIGGIDAVSR